MALHNIKIHYQIQREENKQTRRTHEQQKSLFEYKRRVLLFNLPLRKLSHGI